MNQSEKSVIRTQRKLLAFPWLKDFFNFIKKSLKITEVSQKQLISYMDNYISYLKPESIHCGTRPNKAFYLAQSIIETLLLFKNINYEFDLSQEYLSRLHQILGNYVDLELKGSLRGKETVAEITTRIILTLEAHTKPAESINFMYVFLNMRRLQNGHRDILQLLFIRYLKPNITQYEFDDNDFLIYLIVFKLWRNIETCLAEKTKVSELAEKFMKPKSSFRNNNRISRCLPQNALQGHESNAAYYILQNKFNVERLIRVLKHNSTLEFYDEDIIDLDSDEITDLTIIEASELTSRITNSDTVKEEKPNLTNYIDLTEQEQTPHDKLFWLQELSQNAKNAILEKRICESFNETKKKISCDIILLDDEDQIIPNTLPENSNSIQHIIKTDTSRKLNIEMPVPNISDKTSKGDTNNTTHDNVVNNDANEKTKINNIKQVSVNNISQETSQNNSKNSQIPIAMKVCANSESISCEFNVTEDKNDIKHVEVLKSIKLINPEDHLCKSPFLSINELQECSKDVSNENKKKHNKNLDESNVQNLKKNSEKSNIVFRQARSRKILNEPVISDESNTNVVFSVESSIYHKQSKNSAIVEDECCAGGIISEMKPTNDIIINFSDNEYNETQKLSNIELPITFEFLDESASYTQSLSQLAVGDLVTINEPMTHLSQITSSATPAQPILAQEMVTLEELETVKNSEITNATIPIQNQLQPQLIYTNLPNISPLMNSGITNPIDYAPYISKNLSNFPNQEDTTFQSEQANQYVAQHQSNLQTINILQQPGLNTNSSTTINPVTREVPATLQTFNLIPTQRSIFVNNLDGSITVMDPLIQQHQQSNVNFSNNLANNVNTLSSQQNQIVYNCSPLLQNNYGNSLQSYNYESTSIPNELQNVNVGYNLGSGNDLSTLQYAQTFHTNQQYATTQNVQPSNRQQHIAYPTLNVQNMLNISNYPINSSHLNNYLHNNQINVQETQSLIPILSYQQNSECTTKQLKNED